MSSTVIDMTTLAVTRLECTFLVAGGAGFIGSHLCERLLQNGNRVLCLDNFHTGRMENIAHLRDDERFSVVKHDIADPLPALSGIDGIYNLASPASPIAYGSDPVRTVRTNVFGTLHLLELAAANKARFLQASTSEIYGDPLVHPQPESYCGNVNPIGPRACYDEGKRCAETLVFDFQRTRNLDVKVARIFNTFGPRMRPDDGRVVSNFTVQALQGTDITVYGTGTQTRSFCYVDDLIEGLLLLMRSPRAVTGPINLGNPLETPVKDLAQLIVWLTGSQSRLVHVQRPQDDPQVRRPVIEKAERELGWRPDTHLVEGLARTINYFEHILGDSQRRVGAAE